MGLLIKAGPDAVDADCIKTNEGNEAAKSPARLWPPPREASDPGHQSVVIVRKIMGNFSCVGGPL